MKKIMLLAALVIACAEDGPDTRYVSYGMNLPDGTYGIGVRCVQSQDFCYYESGRRCPYGYNIIQSGGTNETNASGHGAHYYADAYSRWYMIIQCKHN